MIVLMAGMGLWLLPAPAPGCTCMPAPAPDDAFTAADAVFLATATEVRSPPAYPAGYYWLLEWIDLHFDTEYRWQSYEVTVQLDVEKAWKGVTTSRTSILSSGDTCGYPFVEGHEYLVYGHWFEGDLYTSICSRTVAGSHAAQDLKLLAGRRQLALSDAAPIPHLLLVSSLLIAAGCTVLALRHLGQARG